MRLMAIGGFDAKQINGFVDLGSKVARFYTTRSNQKNIDSRQMFKKNTFSSYDQFRNLILKYNPHIVFIAEPIKIDSLDYNELIEIVRDLFPELDNGMIGIEPEPTKETTGSESIETPIENQEDIWDTLPESDEPVTEEDVWAVPEEGTIEEPDPWDIK